MIINIVDDRIKKSNTTFKLKIMKLSDLKFTIILLTMLFMLSCDIISVYNTDNSKLKFKLVSINNPASSDTISFSGKSLNWVNVTTGEVNFSDTTVLKQLAINKNLICYLDSDSLFTARITLPVMSSIYNDLVLNLNYTDNNYYFEDGYPGWVDNLGATTLRAQNKEKRAVAWKRFIDELKIEGKYKE